MKTKSDKRLRLGLSGLLLFFSCYALATPLPAPEGDVLLVIAGNIENTNAEDEAGKPVAKLDLQLLESLTQTTVETDNPWIEESDVFLGVTLKVLLEYVGAKSQNFEAIGVDGYAANLENVDFDKYPVIVAYKRAGEYISVRDLGPLWIIYPFDDYPELDIDPAHVSSVWQLIRMNIL